MNKNQGFSLVELMVVIAIVALLAAVAVPSYRGYMARVDINDVITRMKTIGDQAQLIYETTGSFPTNMTVNGVYLGGGSPAWQTVNWGKIVNFNYTRSPDGNGFLIQSASTVMSFLPGYVAPGPGTIGTYTEIVYGVRVNNGITYIFCGAYNGFGSTEVPLEYLPQGCRCQNGGGGGGWYANGSGPCTQL